MHQKTKAELAAAHVSVDVFIAVEREATAGLIHEPEEQRDRDTVWRGSSRGGGGGRPGINRGRVKNTAKDTWSFLDMEYKCTHRNSCSRV